jgi:hypothetical protein
VGQSHYSRFLFLHVILLLKKDMELVVNIDQMVVIQPNSCGAIQTIELEKHKSRLLIEN